MAAKPPSQRCVFKLCPFQSIHWGMCGDHFSSLFEVNVLNLKDADWRSKQQNPLKMKKNKSRMSLKRLSWGGKKFYSLPNSATNSAGKPSLANTVSLIQMGLHPLALNFYAYGGKLHITLLILVLCSALLPVKEMHALLYCLQKFGGLEQNFKLGSTKSEGWGKYEWAKMFKVFSSTPPPKPSSPTPAPSRPQQPHLGPQDSKYTLDPDHAVNPDTVEARQATLLFALMLHMLKVPLERPEVLHSSSVSSSLCMPRRPAELSDLLKCRCIISNSQSSRFPSKPCVCPVFVIRAVNSSNLLHYTAGPFLSHRDPHVRSLALKLIWRLYALSHTADPCCRYAVLMPRLRPDTKDLDRIQTFVDLACQAIPSSLSLSEAVKLPFEAGGGEQQQQQSHKCSESTIAQPLPEDAGEALFNSLCQMLTDTMSVAEPCREVDLFVTETCFPALLHSLFGLVARFPLAQRRKGLRELYCCLAGKISSLQVIQSFHAASPAWEHSVLDCLHDVPVALNLFRRTNGTKGVMKHKSTTSSGRFVHGRSGSNRAWPSMRRPSIRSMNSIKKQLSRPSLNKADSMSLAEKEQEAREVSELQKQLLERDDWALSDAHDIAFFALRFFSHVSYSNFSKLPSPLFAFRLCDSLDLLEKHAGGVWTAPAVGMARDFCMVLISSIMDSSLNQMRNDLGGMLWTNFLTLITVCLKLFFFRDGMREKLGNCFYRYQEVDAPGLSARDRTFKTAKLAGDMFVLYNSSPLPSPQLPLASSSPAAGPIDNRTNSPPSSLPPELSGQHSDKASGQVHTCQSSSAASPPNSPSSSVSEAQGPRPPSSPSSSSRGPATDVDESQGWQMMMMLTESASQAEGPMRQRQRGGAIGGQHEGKEAPEANPMHPFNEAWSIPWSHRAHPTTRCRLHTKPKQSVFGMGATSAREAAAGTEGEAGGQREQGGAGGLRRRCKGQLAVGGDVVGCLASVLLRLGVRPKFEASLYAFASPREKAAAEKGSAVSALLASLTQAFDRYERQALDGEQMPQPQQQQQKEQQQRRAGAEKGTQKGTAEGLAGRGREGRDQPWLQKLEDDLTQAFKLHRKTWGWMCGMLGECWRHKGRPGSQAGPDASDGGAAGGTEGGGGGLEALLLRRRKYTLWEGRVRVESSAGRHLNFVQLSPSCLSRVAGNARPPLDQLTTLDGLPRSESSSSARAHAPLFLDSLLSGAGQAGRPQRGDGKPVKAQSNLKTSVFIGGALEAIPLLGIVSAREHLRDPAYALQPQTNSPAQPAGEEEKVANPQDKSFESGFVVSSSSCSFLAHADSLDERNRLVNGMSMVVWRLRQCTDYNGHVMQGLSFPLADARTRTDETPQGKARAIAVSLDLLRQNVELSQHVFAGTRPGLLCSAAFLPAFKSRQGAGKCDSCGKKFGTLRKKYSCKSCGDVICSACSPERTILKHISTELTSRVCSSCLQTINARENFMKALQMEMIASPNFDLDETLGLQAKNQVSQMQADQ